MEVQFPDGTVVRALALRERRESDDWRECGLYMDDRWAPTWPADGIEWEDFGVPRDAEIAADQISEAFERAKSGQHLEIGCAHQLGLKRLGYDDEAIAEILGTVSLWSEVTRFNIGAQVRWP